MDEFESPEIAKALYSQDFPLVDVTVMPDDEIIQHKRVALLELVQKHVRQRDLLDFTDTLVTLLLERLITVAEQLEARGREQGLKLNRRHSRLSELRSKAKRLNPYNALTI